MMNKSIEKKIDFRDDVTGLPITLRLSADLSFLAFTPDFWIAIAQALLNSIRQIIATITEIVIELDSLREALLLSTMMVRVKVELRMVFEIERMHQAERKRILEDSCIGPNKEQLLDYLDRLRQNQLDRIIEHAKF